MVRYTGIEDIFDKEVMMKSTSTTQTNGMQAVAQARDLAEREATHASLTWDCDTSWAGDAYDVKPLRAEE